MTTRTASTSLDTEETSVVVPCTLTYADHLRESDPDEYYATIAALTAYYGASTDPHVTRVALCRRNAWFAANIHTGDVRVFANSCKSRWCYHCARGRAVRIALATKTWVSALTRPKLLTLTLKHTTAPLATQLDALYRQFRNFRGDRKIRAIIHGGIWFVQVTKTENNEWHPHLHCVLDADYLPHDTAKTVWQRVTHGSTIVDIRAIKSPEKAANYVARYVARPANLKEYETDDQCEIIAAFESRRLVGTWGTAHTANLTGKNAFDRSDWRYLGQWTQITSDAQPGSWQYMVVHHWLTHQQLNPAWVLMITDPAEHAGKDPDHEPDPPPKQLDLFEHSARYRH